MRIVVVALCALSLVACGDRKGTDQTPPGTDAGSEAADGSTPAPTALDALKASDLAAACAGFKDAVAKSPNDPQAAFGATLACLPLVLDGPAVTGLIDACKEPRVDVAKSFFGPSGAFAKDKLARAGSSTVSAAIKPVANQPAFGTIAMTPDAIRATVEESTFTSNNTTVTRQKLRLESVDVEYKGANRRARLQLEAYFDNAEWGAQPARPLADGLVVSARQLDGFVSLDIPAVGTDLGANFSNRSAGSIRFVKAGGKAPGSPVEVELVGLELKGWRTNCSPCASTDEYTVVLNGKLTDTINARIDPPLPVKDIKDDTGSPFRPAPVVLLDKCGAAFSSETVRAQADKLVGELKPFVGYLDVVLASADAENFQFVVPGGLFSVDGDIPLNITDARALRATLGGGIAALQVATQYQVLSKPFADLIGTFAYWIADQSTGAPITRQQRDFIARALVTELNAAVLVRKAGFDVGPARQTLLAAIDVANAALTRTPGKAGILNFQATNAKPFADDLAALLATVKASVNGGTQAFPKSPDYSLDLKAYFDAPLDHDAIQTKTKAVGVFKLVAGDPQASTASARNDSADVDKDNLRLALDPVFVPPADQSTVQCNPTAQTGCPARYSCTAGATGGGTCSAPDFVVVDQAHQDQALPANGDPEFVNASSVRPLKPVF